MRERHSYPIAMLLIAFLMPHCPLTVVKRYREQFSVQGVGELAIQKKDPMEGGVTHYKEISVLLYSTQSTTA